MVLTNSLAAGRNAEIVISRKTGNVVRKSVPQQISKQRFNAPTKPKPMSNDELIALARNDGFGNETNTTFPLGNSVNMQWDALGRKTNEVFYDATGVALASNRFAYEPGGQVATAFNALGAGTTNIYNVAGRLVGRLNPDGSTNAWRYDLSGRVVKEILPNGNYWQTVYDDLNRRVTRTFKSLAGATLATGYTQFDTRGNAVQKSDLAGNVFTNFFDGLDRIKLAAGPAIVTVSFQWDLVHYQTNISQQFTTYTYDAYRQTVTSTNALGEKTVTISDALGRPAQVAFYGPTDATPLRVTSTSYSPDHQSVTVTSGTGPNAITRTTWTDNDGHPVLEVGYPPLVCANTPGGSLTGAATAWPRTNARAMAGP